MFSHTVEVLKAMLSTASKCNPEEVGSVVRAHVARSCSAVRRHELKVSWNEENSLVVGKSANNISAYGNKGDIGLKAISCKHG